jgi:putative transposase
MMMCDLLGVSKSGYYDWAGREPSATALWRAELAVQVKAEFVASNETYGYRRIVAALARRGIDACSETIRSITVELGLKPCQPAPWRHNLTEQDGAAGPIPDLVARDFTATRPGEKFVGDITYVPTWQGWLFLATVIDCYSKKVVGYATGDNYKTPLIIAAIRHAQKNGEIIDQAIFHTDRGSNYTSAHFAEFLAANHIRHSVGRTGICYDNAMAESFFACLKNELVHRTSYPTREHARKDIVRYIEFWYNPKRLHSGLGYIPPNEAHNQWVESMDAA